MTWRTKLHGPGVALGTVVALLTLAVGPVAATGPRLPLDEPLRSPVSTMSATASQGMVAVGVNHTCMVVSGGLWCWGDNSRGQLGDGTTVDHRVAAPVLAAPGGAPLAGVTAVAAGSSFTCALLADATVWCWGTGFYGQLGNGQAAASAVPVAVAGLSGATAVVAGAAHACAILADATVRCWGRNHHGQVGDGTRRNRNTPVRAAGIVAATALAAGGAHTCAATGKDGLLRCWGANANGQVGDGTTTDRLRPVLISNMTGVSRLAAGDAHTCAAEDVVDWWDSFPYQVISCWGSNTSGQADPDSRARRIKRPTVVAYAAGLRGLAAGARHSCFASWGGMWCWGANASGQIGDGTGAQSSGTAVVGLGTVDGIGAGGATSCAMVSNEIFAAYLWCWGENGDGQVGNGGSADRRAPTRALRVEANPPALPMDGAAGVAAGGTHSCAIGADATVRCWGDNSVAQLGDSTAEGRASSVAVWNLTDARSIAAGLAHTCALTGAGGIRCWGYNYAGQLGDGTTNHRSAPVAVRGVAGATGIAAGNLHTCAILADRSVACWGDNALGQLGDGSIRSRPTAVAVRGLADATALALGETHSCALVQGGTVSCWGGNRSGELGDGTFKSHRNPAPAAGITGATGLAAGLGYTCALLGDGTVTCWGAAPGRPLESLPEDPAEVPPPFAVAGITGATAITAADSHVCALLADHTVRCWGANGEGQLGDGTTRERLEPVTVSPLAGVTAISASGLHTCAIAGAENRVHCWGAGTSYELGQGLPQRSARPVVAVIAQ